MTTKYVGAFVAAAVLVISPTAVSAQNGANTTKLAENVVAASSSSVQPKAAPAAEPKKICKNLPWTGSRVPRRVCMTAEQWKQTEDDARQ